MTDYDKQALERLVRLEEHVSVRFQELDKALDLARHGIDRRLAGMNEFQKRMDKQEGSFATKDALDSLSKLVYVGLGIVLALEFLLLAWLKWSSG